MAVCYSNAVQRVAGSDQLLGLVLARAQYHLTERNRWMARPLRPQRLMIARRSAIFEPELAVHPLRLLAPLVRLLPEHSQVWRPPFTEFH